MNPGPKPGRSLYTDSSRDATARPRAPKREIDAATWFQRLPTRGQVVVGHTFATVLCERRER